MLEVITNATTLDLVTKEMVMANWDEIDDLNESEVEEAITAASVGFNLWCGRTFTIQRYLETLVASHSLKLVLNESPIVLVNEVKSMGEPIVDFKVDRAVGILHKTDMIPWYGPVRRDGILRGGVAIYDEPLSIEVDYTAGYVTQPIIEDLPHAIEKTIPADLEYACIVQARIIIKGMRGMPVGIPQGIVIGPFEAKYATVDSMVGSGSGYWATAIGDPTMMWFPLEVRRTLIQYRRLM